MRGRVVYLIAALMLAGQALCDPGKTYLFYITENSPGRSVALWLPTGDYRLEWITPTACYVTLNETIRVTNVFHRLLTPDAVDDLILKMTRL